MQDNLAAEIRSAAAFRMTLRFVLIFVSGLLVLGLTIGFAARAGLEHSARSHAENMLCKLSTAYTPDAPGNVIAAVSNMAEDMWEDGLAAGYQSVSGELLAGEITLADPAEGWSVFVLEDRDDD